PIKPPNMISVAPTAKPARMMFGVGTQTGYRLDASGAVTARKTYTLSKPSSAPTNTRMIFTRQGGTWFYVTSGVWAGYWIRQSNVSWLSSAPVSSASAPDATFDPAVRLSFKFGTHTGYRFSTSGVMTAETTSTLAADSPAPTSMRKALTNQSGTWFYVTSGVWAGYWLRASDVLYLS